MDMAQRIREDARLIILKELSRQVDERLHSGQLAAAIYAYGGIDQTREWVHGELAWLENMGAVTLTRPGTVIIATLTETGARHLRRAVAIEGISRPSRSGE